MEKQCKHCLKYFDTDEKPKGWMANHSRWCNKNPKRIEYEEKLSNIRDSLKKNNVAKNKRSDSLKKVWKNGGYKNIDFGKGMRGKQHLESSKQKISKAALSSCHRRLKKGVIEYKGILLDSTWEFELAKRLDDLNIYWTRPNPIKWVDDKGTTRNYFPDFYLPKYDLYLDPKNPQAYKVQKNKIYCLNSQYNNIIWLLSLDECKNFTITTKN